MTYLSIYGITKSSGTVPVSFFTPEGGDDMGGNITEWPDFESEPYSGELRRQAEVFLNSANYDLLRIKRLAESIVAQCKERGLKPSHITGLSRMRIQFMLFGDLNEDKELKFLEDYLDKIVKSDEIIKVAEHDPQYEDALRVSELLKIRKDPLYLNELFDYNLADSCFLARYCVKTVSDVRTMTDLERRMTLRAFGKRSRTRFKTFLRLLDEN